MLRGDTVCSRAKTLKQRPLTKNLPDGTGKCPNVRGKGEGIVSKSGLRWLDGRKDLF